VDVILAFDLGMKLGWAVLSDDGARCCSGRLGLPVKPRWIRWQATADKARDLFEEWSPRRVVFERPVGRNDGGGRATFIVHGGLLAQIEVEAHRAGVPEPVALSPTEWKRASVGNGNASKPAYVDAANKLFNLHLDIKGEDEAAALLIGLAAIRLGKVP
jgi:Holliday junction resolvasome RuvABC endonuclease subunit